MIFKVFGENISYKDSLQLDGAFSVAHINYGKSPKFGNIDSKEVAKKSRKDSISSQEMVEDVLDCIRSFNGIEKNFKKTDKIQLWKIYWLEYINAFDKLTEVLPDSVVTIYVGRHAVEIGIKYLLLKKGSVIPKTHNLQILANTLFKKYQINGNYMDFVADFCETFCEYIEGGCVEYFRFPEYKNNEFFSGNRLDIRWLSYNFALIILKLLHFDELDKTK